MKKFRISAKKIFLTYSQVNPEITHQHILQELQNKTDKDNLNYVISKEYHKNGGTHFHIVLIHDEKFEIFKPNTLDIQYKEQTFHGNYSPIKSLKQTVTYVCKNNNYITNLENLKNGRILSTKEFIINEVKEKGIEKALLDHFTRDPKKAIAGISVSALKKQFYDIQKLKTILQIDEVNTPFQLHHFDVKGTLKKWIKNPNKTLVLIGESGIGKTQFCKAFVKQKNLKTLLVNHKEDFRRLNESYDAIIIDDANLQEFEQTQLLSIFDNQVNKTIRVLYDNVSKKANILQMVAMNPKEFEDISIYLRQPRFARRICLHKPKQPFILNINIQNNININNNIVNIHNQESFEKHQEDEQSHIVKTQKMVDDILEGKI
jgi:hypothetical protein